jgi:hypothetical protein
LEPGYGQSVKITLQRYSYVRHFKLQAQKILCLLFKLFSVALRGGSARRGQRKRDIRGGRTHNRQQDLIRPNRYRKREEEVSCVVRVGSIRWPGQAIALYTGDTAHDRRDRQVMAARPRATSRRGASIHTIGSSGSGIF